MASAQSLSLADRRVVAAWAADCAERVLSLFEDEAPRDEAPRDDRPRDAIARARRFSRGELDAAGEIRRRFVAGRAASSAVTRPAVAAARAAAQAAGVAHMGAHALGAAAYAAVAAKLAASESQREAAFEAELGWQFSHASADVRSALRRLPALGTDAAGPLGAGLLASGDLGQAIRRLQTALGDPF